MKKNLQQGHCQNCMRTIIWAMQTKINMSLYLKILTNSFHLGTINTQKLSQRPTLFSIIIDLTVSISNTEITIKQTI